MKLFMCNGHPVARLGGEYYIVDTGSPVSFHYADPQALEVAGQGYLLCASPFCDKETADALTGIDVGGFIGMDILQKSGLTIDLENSELEFAAVPGPDPAAAAEERHRRHRRPHPLRRFAADAVSKGDRRTL